jgi:hypothetical protein
VYALNAAGNLLTYQGASWAQSAVGAGLGRYAISEVPGSSAPEYFEKDNQGNVYYYYINSNNQLIEMGGTVAISAIAISAVAETAATNSYPSVFVLNSAGNVYDLEYNPATGSWIPICDSHGDPVATGVTAISAVPAATTTNNYPSVFVLNGIGNVYDIAFTPGSSWGWGGICDAHGDPTATGVMVISAAPAATTTNNYPSVFVLNGIGNVYDIAFTPGSSWGWGGIGDAHGDPVAVGVTAISAVAASSATNNYPSVFVFVEGAFTELAYNPALPGWQGSVSNNETSFTAISPISSNLVLTVSAIGVIEYYEFNGSSWIVYL